MQRLTRAPGRRRATWGLLWLAAAGYAAVPAAAQTGAATGVAAAVPQVAEGGPIAFGTRFRMASRTLGDTREINVWLPPDYEQGDQHYPVVYLVDGGLEQDFLHIAGLAQLASLSWTYGPMILVGVETRRRTAELTAEPTDERYREAFPESGGAGRFREFLEAEVIPFVEQRFRAGPRRALMGESLAGLFVVETLLTRPELFSDYVAVSPSLWWDDRRLVKGAGEFSLRTKLAGRRLYLAAADEGGTMQDGIDRLRTALAPVASAEFELRYADRSTMATHATIFHGAAEEALRWLYPAPEAAAITRPWYMIEGAEPPAAD